MGQSTSSLDMVEAHSVPSESTDISSRVVDLSIICVNWNSLDYLLECVASVYEHTHGISFELIVVDNASPEGRIELLNDQFPEVTIVRSEKNVGFAGANNLGFRHSRGQHILLLNPDTKLMEPAINIMLEHLSLCQMRASWAANC